MAKLPYSKLVTPPHVYYDDTGCTKHTGPEFIWAGYLATYSFWEMFGKTWNKILDRRPRIEYWHETDARAKNRTTSAKNPFRALKDAQMLRRERALCELLGDNADRIVPICMRIKHADLDAHVPKRLKLARQLTKAEEVEYRPDVLASPQFIALLGAVKACTGMQAKDAADAMPLSVHCESRDGDPMQDYMARGWKVLRAKDRSRFGAIDFPPGKSRVTPQLQAADMLAWHLNWRNKNRNAPDDPMWELIGGRKVRDYYIGADELKRHVALWARWWPVKAPPTIWTPKTR